MTHHRIFKVGSGAPADSALVPGEGAIDLDTGALYSKIGGISRKLNLVPDLNLGDLPNLVAARSNLGITEPVAQAAIANPDGSTISSNYSATEAGVLTSIRDNQVQILAALRAAGLIENTP